MDVATVTLGEVLAAAHARAASLVPETSGYLVLAVADCCERSPFRVEDEMVTVTTEGTVSVARGHDVVEPGESAQVVRDMLFRLLGSSIGSMRALAGAARSREEGSEGVRGLVRELEAALIPVNRAAARRALGRLARETAKAKERGILQPMVGIRRSRKSSHVPAQPTPKGKLADAVAEPQVQTLGVAWPMGEMSGSQVASRGSSCANTHENVDVACDELAEPQPEAAAEDMVEVALEPVNELVRLGVGADSIPTPLAAVSVESAADSAADFPADSAADSAAESPDDADGTIVDSTTFVELGESVYLRGSVDSPIIVEEDVPARRSDVSQLLGKLVATRYDTDASLRMTRASLKRLAGVDPTPPPPAVEMFSQPRFEPEPRVRVEVSAKPMVSRPKRSRYLLLALGLGIAGLVGHYAPTWIEKLGWAHWGDSAPVQIVGR